jgi:hypothetical protein
MAPRRTIATLGANEGRHDGTWACLAWVLAVELVEVSQAIARVTALRTQDASFRAVFPVAIAVVPPFVAWFAVGRILGRERAHRAGTCLTPMIVSGVVLRHMEIWQRWTPSPSWLPAAIAGLLAVALASWVKPAVRAIRPEAR